MCTGTAYGKCICRSNTWTMVGSGDRILCELSEKSHGNWKPACFSGQYGRALCCGIVYHFTKRLDVTCIAEALGTGVLGGLAAYPVAKLLMGLEPGGFTVYMIPFFISTLAGSILAYIVLRVLEKSHVLEQMREN